MPRFTSIALCACAVVSIAFNAVAQREDFTEITAPWLYTTNNLDGVSWADPGYDDSGWSGPGNALLYIETATLPAPKNTPLPPRSDGKPRNTYYFRTVLAVTNVGEVSFLTFSNLLDDGAVFYLNGSEIRRIRMPVGTITYDTFSSVTVDDATTFDVFTIFGDTLTNLVEGENILAVEVHQRSSDSSDVVFGSAVSTFHGEPPVTVVRGPYLQLSTPASIVIRWRTYVPAGSLVIYGTNLAALVFTNLDVTGVVEHEVTLTNLAPDTKYFYAVGSSVETMSGPDADQFFLTHPWPGTEKPIRVWVIGDAGTTGYGTSYALQQLAVRDAFEAFNGTNTLHAWLQLGDNAYPYGTDNDYQAGVFNIYTNELRSSVTWPTLGNHDAASGAPYAYFDIFTLPTTGAPGGVPSATEQYYSFDLGMVHFICLDSMTANRATNGAMALWLRSDLEMNTNRWTIAYWHHPPYSKGSHNSDSEIDSGRRMVDMRENFLPILEAGGVDLVLTGHSHSYERSYLIDGHYGLSGTFDTNSMIVQPGNGRETNGVGAYLKPDGLGESPVGNQGAVYAVAGSSGQISGGSLDHPVMFTSQNVLGSMVLDFASNRMDAVFLRETDDTDDWFSIIKEGTHPPVLTNIAMTAGNGFEFTVLTRAHRTNVIEATGSPGSPVVWTPVSTNVPSDPVFEILDTSAVVTPERYYRVRRP